MNIRLLLPPLLVTLFVLSGCRRDPHLQVYIDNMNAEKRLLEDTLYDLQYDYETKAAEVDKLRRELDSCRSGGTDRQAPADASADAPGSSRAPREMFPDIPDLQLPQIDEGQQRPSGSSGTEKPGGDQDDPDDLEPPKLDLGDGQPLSAVSPPTDQQVTQLYLHPELTGGLQQDDQPGDDGIVVAFEPRNRDHQFVPRASRVSVALVDPASRTPVASWEFSAAETATALQNSPAHHGIELTLPWQASPPTQERLLLSVRYWLPDGRDVEADRQIRIEPGNQIAARWTPRTPARPRATRPAERRGEEVAAEPQRSGERPGTWEAASAPAADAKQARRPLWQPYR